MIFLFRFRALIQSIFSIFWPWIHLAAENILLHQELVTLKQQSNIMLRISLFHKLLNWLTCFITWILITLHRKGFKIYWKHITKIKTGRHKIAIQIRHQIKHLMHDNPTWGAPRIHGELLKLGFDISERTVSRYLKRFKPFQTNGHLPGLGPFINNHWKGFAAMDLFVVPTLSFKQLYVFFIIGHERRKLIHFGVTFHPTAAWVSSQIRQAFGAKKYPGIKYMIHDRDAIFSALVIRTLLSFGIQSRRTDYCCPWQNGVAERWVGSCRRELLDHVIIFNPRHLEILLTEYVQYYNEDRTHYSLGKDPPVSRPVQERHSDMDKLIAIPRVGGLHHKYVWQSAA
jgi:transposase InsO family protein